MPVFISLLRGINVSGHRMISMADLKALYQSLGYTNVRSYLQSGNVVFDASSAKPAKYSAAIAKAIAAELGHQVTVVVKTAEELRRITASNPFTRLATIDPQFLHATFLAAIPKGLSLKQLKLPLQGKEAAHQIDDVLYLYCPNGYGRTRINNSFFEKQFSTQATTRNWRTVTALDGLAHAG